MPKKEALLPESTIGGRIQKLRHQKKLSRSEFYDRVFPYGEAGSDESKERTVRSWESEKYELNYQSMEAVCKVLGCSSDYLLGLDECTNKTNQFIHEQTGLSEDVIEVMLRHADEDDWTLSLDFLLRSSDFVLYLVPAIYKIAFCAFTYSYTDWVNRKAKTPEQYCDEIIEEYVREDGLKQLEISDSIVHILDKLRGEAIEKAKQAIDSSTGSRTHEEIVEYFKSFSSVTYPDIDILKNPRFLAYFSDEPF